MLNKEEIQVTLQLIDLAVKAGGLNVAQAALTISGKLQNAIKEAEDNGGE